MGGRWDLQCKPVRREAAVEQSRSAVVSVRLPLPEGFHADVESKDDDAMAMTSGDRRERGQIRGAVSDASSMQSAVMNMEHEEHEEQRRETGQSTGRSRLALLAMYYVPCAARCTPGAA